MSPRTRRPLLLLLGLVAVAASTGTAAGWLAAAVANDAESSLIAAGEGRLGHVLARLTPRSE